jgi:hypothetical protein
MFEATLRDIVPVDTVLEAAGHRAELAAALALVPHRVPLSRCIREEQSL